MPVRRAAREQDSMATIREVERELSATPASRAPASESDEPPGRKSLAVRIRSTLVRNCHVSVTGYNTHALSVRGQCDVDGSCTDPHATTVAPLWVPTAMLGGAVHAGATATRRSRVRLRCGDVRPGSSHERPRTMVTQHDREATTWPGHAPPTTRLHVGVRLKHFFRENSLLPVPSIDRGRPFGPLVLHGKGRDTTGASGAPVARGCNRPCCIGGLGARLRCRVWRTVAGRLEACFERRRGRRPPGLCVVPST